MHGGSKMRRYTISALILVLLFAFGCAPVEEKPIGGQRDEHGCLTAAGYQWCPSKQKCLRAWEEYCEEYKEQFRIDSFEDCVAAGNPVMESYPRQCRTEEGVTYVEDEFQRAKPSIPLEDALSIAQESGCLAEGGSLIPDSALYNPNTKTWWIDLDLERQGCSPACVVDDRTGTAEINWRCTGLVEE